MARFQYGSGITAIAQSAGGATFMQAGPTGIVRNKRAVARVQDFHALANRAFFFQLVKAWNSSLSASDRIDWIALGGTRTVVDVLGNAVPLNGMGTFIRFNLPLLQDGLPFNTTPPVDFTTTALSSFTIDALSGPQTIKLTALSPNIAANEKLIIACSVSRSAGYTSVKHRPRILHREQGPVTTPIDFSPRWIDYGGILQTGTALIAYIKVLNQDSGFYGPKLFQIVPVT